MSKLTPFELERNARVKRNQAQLAALVKPLAMPPPPPRAASATPRKAPGPKPPPAPPRNSTRIAGKPAVRYASDEERGQGKPRGGGGARSVRVNLTLDELEAMTEEEREAVRRAARRARRGGAERVGRPSGFSRAPRTTAQGRRRQGLRTRAPRAGARRAAAAAAGGVSRPFPFSRFFCAPGHLYPSTP